MPLYAVSKSRPVRRDFAASFRSRGRCQGGSDCRASLFVYGERREPAAPVCQIDLAGLRCNNGAIPRATVS
jgi:hypothetical protein